MADTDKLKALKEEAEQLRNKVAEIRESKNDGLMEDAASGRSLKQFVPLPKCRKILKGHYGKVYAVSWAENKDGKKVDNFLVSASQDGKLIVWDGQTTNKCQVVPLRSSWVMTCSFEKSQGRLVACGGLDNLCSIYDLSQRDVSNVLKELAAHEGYLSGIHFFDEKNLLTSSGDSTCIYWDIETGEAKQTFAEHTGDVMTISAKPNDSNIFVSGSCDATLRLWDIRQKKSTHVFVGHESDINQVVFLPNGNAFCSGSDDSTCRLFDIRSYSEINIFGSDRILCGITSVDCSKSGRLLFAGYDDYNCYVWDVLSGKASSVFQLQGHENRVSCVGVNPSGMAVATGSWDTHLRIWA